MVILYRTVHHNPPNEVDFRSGKDMGLQKPSPSKEPYWLGFSAYDSLDQARAIALKYPHQGDYIAEFAIPDTAIITLAAGAFTLPPKGRITIARSFGPGHWTVWGAPHVFPPLIQDITPLRR